MHKYELNFTILSYLKNNIHKIVLLNKFEYYIV